MTPRRALAPETTVAVGSAAKPPTLRSFTAALLFAPLFAFAQQPAAPDTAAAPAPAVHEDPETPRRPGETTTGRPPAPAVPAPPVSTAPLSPTATAPLGEAPRVSLPASMPTATSPGAGGLLQTVMALMLVLALLAGLAWVMKRYGPKMSGGSANLRVVGALNLGGRERIMVVEVGDQWIVVGAAPGRVNALHTMPRQEGELTPAASHGGVPSNNFSDWLKKTIDKRNAR